MYCLQLAEDISRKEEEREEMERIRMELVLEEQEEKERQKERVRNMFIFHCSEILITTVVY